MPEERVKLDLVNTNLKGMASCNEEKAAVAIWNLSATEQQVSLTMNNLPFSTGNFKLYRIDQTHASFFDGAPENLEADESGTGIDLKGFSWKGTIAASGVIYITLDNGSGVPAFDPDHAVNQPANDTRTYNFYPQRGISTYAFFDRKTWTAYLGMGNELYRPSFTAVEASGLPDQLHFSVGKSSNIQDYDKNSILGVRLDFRVNGEYTQSIFYHDGIYHTDRTFQIPWGTRKVADQVLKLADMKDFTVNLKAVAPEDWDGRVLISFLLGSAGPHSQVKIKVTDPQASSTGPGTEKKTGMKVYGSGGSRNIEYEAGEKPLEFRIYNLEGKLLQSFAPDGSGFQCFSVSQLSAGIYLLSGLTRQGPVNLKFVVN
jgi:hypothetical protein